MAILVLWGAFTECEPIRSEGRQLEPVVHTADQKHFIYVVFVGGDESWDCVGKNDRCCYLEAVAFCIHELQIWNDVMTTSTIMNIMTQLLYQSSWKTSTNLHNHGAYAKECLSGSPRPSHALQGSLRNGPRVPNHIGFSTLSTHATGHSTVSHPPTRSRATRRSNLCSIRPSFAERLIYHSEANRSILFSVCSVLIFHSLILKSPKVLPVIDNIHPPPSRSTRPLRRPR